MSCKSATRRIIQPSVAEIDVKWTNEKKSLIMILKFKFQVAAVSIGGKRRREMSKLVCQKLINSFDTHKPDVVLLQS